MKTQGRIARALQFSSVVAGLILLPAIGRTQEARGWIEGTVLNKSGKIVWDSFRQANLMTVRAVGLNKTEAHPDHAMGNFFTMRDLRPGVYEIFVSASKDDELQYRPQHIMGLVVKPGERTLLNIVVHEGRSDAIEEVGKAVPTETGATLADMVERLTRELDVVKKQVSELRMTAASRGAQGSPRATQRDGDRSQQ